MVEDGRAITFVPSGDAGPRAGLLFMAGATVDPWAYAPFASDLAHLGHEVVIVKLPWRLAPLTGHRTALFELILERIEEGGSWVVGGHSRGAALAAEFASLHSDEPAGLLLVATSHPKRLDLSELRIPVAKIYGTRDGLASLEEIEAYRSNLPAHTRWFEVEGGNHAQFAWYGRQLGDRSATIDRQEQHGELIRSTSEFLAALRPRIDLFDPERYREWGSLSNEEAVARCEAFETRPLRAGETLIAVGTGASDRDMGVTALAVVGRTGFRATDSQELRHLDSLVSAADGAVLAVRPQAFFNRINNDHCYWSATASDAAPDSFVLLTSSPAEIDTTPSEADLETFFSIRTQCVVQGDFPAGEEPLCVRPELMGTSDLDGDGWTEFWYTEPLMWDTGFAVAEIDVTGTRLDMIVSVCPGCD